jgi:hypothetical protein
MKIEGSAVSHFTVLSGHFPGGKNENHRNLRITDIFGSKAWVKG